MVNIIVGAAFGGCLVSFGVGWALAGGCSVSVGTVFLCIVVLSLSGCRIVGELDVSCASLCKFYLEMCELALWPTRVPRYLPCS